MPTMNVSLTKDLAELVASRIRSGRYASASEVVRDALRALERRDLSDAEKLERLKADIAEGLASGPPRPLDVADILRRAKATAAKQRRR